MQPLFEDGHKHVDRDGDPDLRPHRVWARSDEPLDAQMLLDPFEEEFDSPPRFV